MKEVESWEILVSLSANEISLAEAHDQILRLFNDAGQSEQLCGNLDKDFNCKNMCLTHCIDGNQFWK